MITPIGFPNQPSSPAGDFPAAGYVEGSGGRRATKISVRESQAKESIPRLARARNMLKTCLHLSSRRFQSTATHDDHHIASFLAADYNHIHV